MLRFAIAKKDDNETSVRSLDAPDFRQLQGVLVKSHALFQIEYIEIIVGESKFHIFASFPIITGQSFCHCETRLARRGNLILTPSAFQSIQATLCFPEYPTLNGRNGQVENHYDIFFIFIV
jgi:hypothetical protein